MNLVNAAIGALFGVIVAVLALTIINKINQSKK